MMTDTEALKLAIDVATEERELLDSLSSACSLELIAAMVEADTRYRQQQKEGDTVSIASTRATYLATRDCLMIFRRFFKVNK